MICGHCRSVKLHTIFLCVTPVRFLPLTWSCFFCKCYALYPNISSASILIYLYIYYYLLLRCNSSFSFAESNWTWNMVHFLIDTNSMQFEQLCFVLVLSYYCVSLSTINTFTLNFTQLCVIGRYLNNCVEVPHSTNR
jgi:hypothetical protein